MKRDASFNLKHRWKKPGLIVLLVLTSLRLSMSPPVTMAGPVMHASVIASASTEISRKLSRINQYNREIRDLNDWFANLPPDQRAGEWNRLVDEVTRRGAAIDRLYDEIDRIEAGDRLDEVAEDAGGNFRQ